LRSRRAMRWRVAFAWMLGIVCACASVAAAPAPSAAGQWRVEFATPLGERAVSMTINQSGTRLSGHVVDPYGEYELNGHIAGGRVTAAWSAPESGRMIEITMKGTLDGNRIEGTAKIGDVGEGALSARRTGDAGDR
jgi:hypothetical protein